MSERRSVSGGYVALAFLAGAAAGAAVALLTSPKNGREMRASVANWARRNSIGDALAKATRAAQESFEGARED